MDNYLVTLEELHKITGCSYRTILKRLQAAKVRPVTSTRKSEFYTRGEAVAAITSQAERASPRAMPPAAGVDPERDALALEPITALVPVGWFGEPALLAGALGEVLGAEVASFITPADVLRLQGVLLLLYMQTWNAATGRSLRYSIPDVLHGDPPSDVLQKIERGLRRASGFPNDERTPPDAL